MLVYLPEDFGGKRLPDLAEISDPENMADELAREICFARPDLKGLHVAAFGFDAPMWRFYALCVHGSFPPLAMGAEPERLVL